MTAAHGTRYRTYMLASVFPFTTVLLCVHLCFWEQNAVGTVSIGFSVFPLSAVNGSRFIPNLSPPPLKRFNTYSEAGRIRCDGGRAGVCCSPCFLLSSHSPVYLSPLGKNTVRCRRPCSNLISVNVVDACCFLESAFSILTVRL